MGVLPVPMNIELYGLEIRVPAWYGHPCLIHVEGKGHTTTKSDPASFVFPYLSNSCISCFVFSVPSSYSL